MKQTKDHCNFSVGVAIGIWLASGEVFTTKVLRAQFGMSIAGAKRVLTKIETAVPTQVTAEPYKPKTVSLVPHIRRPLPRE